MRGQMETSNTSEKRRELAQIFIDEYNAKKGWHYKFEYFRRSMFSIQKYKFPAFEIYQMAFIERKNRDRIVADLMVLLRLKKRLIIEVVEPNLRQEDVKGTKWSRLVEDIIDPIERDALREVVCSRYLLIDGRNFDPIKIPDPEIYRKDRLERDKLVGRHKRELSQMGVPVKHWFNEIWLSYHDEKGVVRCLQIW